LLVRRLIVNADDFGLTRGVNRAIVELNRQQVLTSATLMARAAATSDAISLARKTPSLGVGCHVVLVDGEPTLRPPQIPSLIETKTGRFHPKLGSFVRRLLTGQIEQAQVQAEASAQMAVLIEAGIVLTHIDTHKHAHMLPAVLRPVLRAARSAGIIAVRNPFEPAWSREATAAAPRLRRFEVALLHRLEPAFRRIVAEEGFTTTDGAVGVLATGTLDQAAVSSLLRAMPPGTWELVTHPGHNDADLKQANTRLLASRETELQAIKAVAEIEDVELIRFSDLNAR
jgi:hopanoid biosynthesis associated protein HpnK